ncbi:MAG: UDP-3-O-(3-hydroxymyristoyl)glucosamine N-acyltransferase [Nitrospirota bacterium]|nr:UDP-3-O-(3-hydroxymyristoyl)glucosamine N-acyltransferase [Nitrospirota bacterium]
MLLNLKEFSEMVNGEIIGDPDIEITGVSGINDAKKGDITFISSSKFIKDIGENRASCVIVGETIDSIDITQLKVSNPYYAFARALEYFHPGPSFKPGISEKAAISDNVVTGANVSISPFCYISDNVSIGDETVVLPGVFIGANTKIGRRCVIHPNVVIREDVQIGDRVIIHPGTVLGSDGFGYVFENGVHYKIPQVGGVVIEDDVEIGSNVSIDRATLGHTVIGRGTKIDNLVQIAHNVKIGENSIVVAQVAIGGSAVIGSFVTIAGQVGISDHATIDSGAIIGAQSGVTGHITKGAYSGSPAIPHKNWLRSQSLFAKLPDMNGRLKDLEKKLNKLEKGMQHDEHK